MAVINPIHPGFEWRQAFDFPGGWLQAGDQLRAQVRHRVKGRLYADLSSPDAGLTIEGSRVVMTLSEEQTRELREGSVVTNFALVRNGVQSAIGILITLPVADLPTQALLET